MRSGMLLAAFTSSLVAKITWTVDVCFLHLVNPMKKWLEDIAPYQELDVNGIDDRL